MHDFFYPFDYTDQLLPLAVKRLNCSIGSVINQGVNVIVCNTSTQCIKDQICFHVTYIHVPRVGRFNKPITINIGVKRAVTSPYFFISDVDLSYPSDYVQRSLAYTNVDTPVRVIPHVIGMDQQCYGSYDELLALGGKTESGLAHGNGLIHTQSFMDVRGYNETMFGYGPEDDEFNKRLSFYGNAIIDNSNITTIHIWHPRGTDPGSTHDLETFKQNQLTFHNIVTNRIVVVNGERWGEI